MADLIESLKSIHESVTFGLHGLQHISVAIRSLMVRQDTKSQADKLGFGFGSGPKWHDAESEFVWSRLSSLEEYTSEATRGLVRWRAVFTKANEALASRRGTDPLVRLPKTTAASWHQACTSFLNWFEYELDLACEKECVDSWRDLLNHENCPTEFKSINMLRAIGRAVDSAALTYWLLEEWIPRLEFEFAEAIEQGGVANEDADSTPTLTENETGDKLPNALAAVRGVYEWATSKIDAADGMTIEELFDAIQSHPEMTTDYLDLLPKNWETFGTYLRRAGIHRYKKCGSRARRPSRHPRT